MLNNVTTSKAKGGGSAGNDQRVKEKEYIEKYGKVASATLC